jgi:hypothetical protein
VIVRPVVGLGAGLAVVAVVGSGCSPFATPRVEISGLAARAGAGEIHVTFRTDRPAFAGLDAWPTGRPGDRRSAGPRDLPGTEFAVLLSGLAPDTEYTFRVTASDGPRLDRAVARSPDRTVRTLRRLAISRVDVRPGDTTAAVTWRTDLPADSRVEYGRGDEYEASKTNVSERARHAHEVRVGGLVPGASYRLRVVARDAAGQAEETRSDAVSFRTAAARNTAGAAAELSPRQPPGGRALADVGRQYLDRLENVSADEKARMARQIGSGDGGEASAGQLELSATERSELAGPTRPGDRRRFDRRVELVHRWVLSLERRGSDPGPLANVAVALQNRYLVAPDQAARELDGAIRDLAERERARDREPVRGR